MTCIYVTCNFVQQIRAIERMLWVLGWFGDSCFDWSPHMQHPYSWSVIEMAHMRNVNHQIAFNNSNLICEFSFYE